MNLKIKGAALALAAAMAVTPVLAQQNGQTTDPPAHHMGQRAHGQFGEQRLNRMAVILDLTDAQKAAAQQIMNNAKQQAQPVVAQLKQNRQTMQAAVKANNTATISQVAAQQGQLAGQLAEIHAKARASFYAQLTPEQKAKADQLHQNRHSRRFNRESRQNG